MRMPGLHELEAFEAAARLGSFAHAAKELHVTESAISHRIRALEEDLGTALFDREYRRVSITPAGAAYRDFVREAFSALAEARRSVDALQRPTVYVAVPGALGARTLGPLFAQFCVDNPDVAMRIAMWEPRISKAMHAADVVVAFSDQPIAGYDEIARVPQTLCAVSSPGYLTALGIREPAGMRRAPLLHHPLMPWREWFRTAGLPVPDRVFAGPLYEDGTTMLESATHGLGVALSPSLAVAPWLATGQLQRCFGVTVETYPYVIHVSREGANAQAGTRLGNWLASRLVERAADLGLTGVSRVVESARC